MFVIFAFGNLSCTRASLVPVELFIFASNNIIEGGGDAIARL